MLSRGRIVSSEMLTKHLLSARQLIDAGGIHLCEDDADGGECSAGGLWLESHGSPRWSPWTGVDRWGQWWWTVSLERATSRSSSGICQVIQSSSEILFMSRVACDKSVWPGCPAKVCSSSIERMPPASATVGNQCLSRAMRHVGRLFTNMTCDLDEIEIYIYLHIFK